MKSSPKNAFAFLFFFTLIFSLTGCAEALVEKSTEAVLENSMEGELGDVDVDLSTGNVQINADGVVYQGGENSSWPDTIPDDVYKIDGTVLSSMTSVEESLYSVVVQLNMSAEEAVAIYEEQLKKEGWSLNGTASFAQTISLIADKENRQLVVMTTTEEETTILTLQEHRLDY